MKKLELFVLATLLVSAAVLSAGCLGGDEETKEYLDAEMMLKDIKAAAGTTTGVPVLLKNLREADDEVNISLKTSPQGWNITFTNTTFVLSGADEYGSSKGFFVIAEIPASAEVRSYDIEFEAASKKYSDYSRTFTVKVQVISPTDVAKEGKTVAVNYIGLLDGTWEIFDTNMDTIGTNQNFKKAASYSSGKYSPLRFKVGDKSMIEGFDEGIRGMAVGQCKLIKVPPEKGYGKFEYTNISVEESVDIIYTYNYSQFISIYSVQPEVSMSLQHSLYKWNITVLEVTPEKVTIRNQPYVGERITPYGWNTTVQSLNSSANNGTGVITIVHHASLNFNTTYNGYSATVTALNQTAITLKYNVGTHRFAGDTLYFIAIPVSISSG